MSIRGSHFAGTSTKFQLLILASAVLAAAPVGAAPVISFSDFYTDRYAPNPLSSLPDGDFVQIVALVGGASTPDPPSSLSVVATQGSLSVPLIYFPFTDPILGPLYGRWLPFAGADTTIGWTLTATDSTGTSAPVVTPAIASPQLLPFATNVSVSDTSTTPTVSWTLPDLTGFSVDLIRLRIIDASTEVQLYNQQLSVTATSFTVPADILVLGESYVYRVMLLDTGAGGTNENWSNAFSSVTKVGPPQVAAKLQLLVSSELTDSVKRYDAETGAYVGEFVSAGFDGQVEPRGLTFGPDGNLYVGGGGDGNPNVKRFDEETGAFIDTVTSGYPARINGLAFGPDGDLYGAVSEGSVFRVDVATGTQLGDIGAGSPLDGPDGVAFGADGNLYVGSSDTGEVLRFNGTTGAFIDVFATVPPGGAAHAVTFGPDGNLYVTVDYCGPAGCLSSDILRFDGTTGASQGSFIAPGDPRPVEPRSLAFGPGPEGDLYVSSHATDEVLRYDGTSGGFIGSVAIGGGLDGPNGIALLAAPPELLVASYNTHNVKRYDGATGAYLGDFVTAGEQANPRGMSLGPDGNLYVGGSSFSAPGSIRRFDGTTGASLGTVTSGHPGAIGDVIFGPDGDLYAPVLLQDYVIHVDPSTGALVDTIGPGSPLVGASGIAFGADGNLYVASYPDNHVLRFDGTDGHYKDVFATVPIAGNAGHVFDVIFGPDGNLLVTIGYAEPTGNIWRFDGTTGASLGAFIPEADPHPAMPTFQVIGPDGNLYVGSAGTDEVWRYDGITGAFIDIFASGGGLDGPFGLAFVPEPGVATQLGAGLTALVALARRRYRGSRGQPLPRA